MDKPCSASIESIREYLEAVGDPADSMEALDAQIDDLAKVFRELRELSLCQSQNVLPERSASERILAYFRQHVGVPVSRGALEVVAGISEYPRRIREWRVEFGWPIKKHGQDSYVLLRSGPDNEKADLWRILNQTRRSGDAGRARMLALFRALPVGTVVTTAQLRYVTEGQDMRRLRELRTELGWKILTRNTGLPHLKTGQYVLVDSEQQETHDRNIDDETVTRVLTRDHQQCRKAGCCWPKTKTAPGDRRQYLEAHHVLWHVDRGPNVEDNLVTLCNVHHRVVHSRGLKGQDCERWLADPS